MKKRLLPTLATLALTALLFTSQHIRAQEYVHRLRPPAKIKGFIGGESHDSYAVHVRKGQLMTVEISWWAERDDDNGDVENHAEFWVGDRPDFDGDGLVKSGKESNGGKRWSAVLTKTADYYIYVVAHPTAHYVLKVTVR